jgi:hypothetical protein
MDGQQQQQQQQRHRGLDILEELERLELQQQTNLAQYDSDDDLLGTLGRTGGRRTMGREEVSRAAVPQVVTQHGFGLTKGARLPDAILVPNEDDDERAAERPSE